MPPHNTLPLLLTDTSPSQRFILNYTGYYTGQVQTFQHSLTPSHSPHPPSPLSCSVCQMLIFSPAPCTDNGTCNKCSIFVAMEARPSQLEVQVHSMNKVIGATASQPPLAGVDPRAKDRHPPAAPEQPGNEEQ